MTGAKRPRTAQILRGRVETRVYYQASYGPLVSCVIEGVTEGHWRSMAITTGAKRPRSPIGRDMFLPSNGHTPIETNMRQGKKIRYKRKPVFQSKYIGMQKTYTRIIFQLVFS